MSVQEVMHQILPLKLHSSSFNVVITSLEGSRKLELENGDEIVTKLSILDHYATREKFINSIDNIMSLNFVQFISKYLVQVDKIFPRKNEVIVRTFPTFSSNPSGPNFSQYCKFQLLRYKPWSVKRSAAWNDIVENDDVFISCWQEFIVSHGQEYVPSWSIELDNVELYYNHDRGQVQCEDTNENGVTEDWMILADLHRHFESNSNPVQDQHVDPAYWHNFEYNFSVEEFGNLPTWLIERKKELIIPPHNPCEVDTSTFSPNQRLAYRLLVDHNAMSDPEQLLLIVTGVAGTGKSYLINAIRYLLKEKCIVMAYFGVAAHNIKGSTLHRILQLPIGGKNRSELKGGALSNLQKKLEGIFLFNYR